MLARNEHPLDADTTSGLGPHDAMTTERNPLHDAKRRRAFARARRHSRRVRTFRLLMPLTAVLLLASFLIPATIRQIPTEIGPVAFDTLGVRDGALVMENPRLAGLDQNERTYNLSAREASRRIDTPQLIDLVEIKASLSVDAGTTAEIGALRGQFDQDAETLTLFDGVQVSASNGYNVLLQDALVDLSQGVISTENAVAIDMLNGALRATGLRIEDRGAVLSFAGPVRMTIRMNPEGTGLATE